MQKKYWMLTRMKQFIITRIITGLLLVHGMHSREQRHSLDWIRVKKLRWKPMRYRILLTERYPQRVDMRQIIRNQSIFICQRVRMHHRLQSIMWKNRKRVLLCMIHPNWMREINIPYSSVEIMQWSISSQHRQKNADFWCSKIHMQTVFFRFWLRITGKSLWSTLVIIPVN